jgi:RHS repeat-associated protein
MLDVTGSSANQKTSSNEQFGVAAPQIALPKGGGALHGIGEKFAANPVTGTGNLSVPIAVSPGRAGFSPQLALSYDSGAGNGPFGLGWSLSLPAITRRTDKGLPKYQDGDESDVFILSGAEDLVPVLVRDASGNWQRERLPDRNGYAVTRYWPRIEGLFSVIERWSRASDGDTYWRSISKDNVTTFYGKTPESRIADPGDPRRIFSWLICQSYDDKGNSIIYQYAAENDENVDCGQANERNRLRTANRYLKRIKYGNRSPNRDLATWNASDPAQLPDQTWMFEVVFDYGEGHYQEIDLDPAQPETAQHRFVRATASPRLPWDSQQRHWAVRADPFSSYRACFEVRTYRLCRRVLMFHHFPDELGTPDYFARATEFAYHETPIASFITSVVQSGFVRQSDGTYLKRSLPPLEFEYSEARVQQEVREVDPESLANLPASTDGTNYRWLDLDGEGMQGVLAENGDAWYYARNLSPLTFDFIGGAPTASARFEPVSEVTKLPAFAEAGAPRHQFLDLDGGGQLDCVVFERPAAGFYERTQEEDWEPFAPLPSSPNVDWSNPNLRFVDLDGDGHADILITEQDAITWYPSLADSGFGAPIRRSKPYDEEDGPAIIFADANQSIFLADMAGGGLTDIVRIRNGEVCYWPNLGYGQFGRKVAMDNAPWFDPSDMFDPQRIRLADIDGSGTTDIIYVAADGIRLYFNQAGNSFAEPETVAAFPPVNSLQTVQALDLIGSGTACLVWTSSLPGDARQSMRYIDLMGGEKPHLLTLSRNNLGAEMRVFYAPSTKFYLADRAAEQPWVTRLPFPVHVVERVETYDWVSRNLFVTRYAYHHGYYDGVEREFRGFGMVEQFDTEELGALTQSGTFPDATNIDAASNVPPVHTKTWFHTGAYLEGEKVSRLFAQEYYGAPKTNDPNYETTFKNFVATLLPDTLLPDSVLLPDRVFLPDGTPAPDFKRLPLTLSADDEREACRALKGSILREEVFALDGSAKREHPYTVSERCYTIEMLQPMDGNRHAVFFVHPRETIDYHYERNPADPRISHALTLAVDPYGNVLQSGAIGYGRKQPDPDPLLTDDDRAKQAKIHVTYTESMFTNPILEADAYRPPLPAGTRTYELINAAPVGSMFGLDEIAAKVAEASQHELPYEDVNAIGATGAFAYRRLIEHVRTLYRNDDLSGALPFGTVESLALPYESYKLAFTPGLLTVFSRNGKNLLPDAAAVLREGGYVLGDDQRTADLFPADDPDGRWWIPSGRILYSPVKPDTTAQELTKARAHFFLPRRIQDPFGNSALVLYDKHDLLVVETEDAVGNKNTAGTRSNDNSIGDDVDRASNGGIINRNDYRVLQSALLSDPNGNQAEIAFDALGMAAGTAVMGKPAEDLGDSLSGFVADLTKRDLDQFFADPKGPAAATFLAGATTRILYDFDRFVRSGNAAGPVYAATIARETHVSDLGQGQSSKLQVSFGYSDGFGREVQKKRQAERGPVIDGGPPADPRWVGSGWAIFNNKGKPVRRYEPFFDDTHDFKFVAQVGVSPVLLYDPVERIVATLHPNHTWEKVVFDPWRQESSDVNDTATFDPKTDGDVKEFFTRLPDADYVPSWYTLRIDPSLAATAAGLWPDPKIRAGESDAASKAAVHADTPALAFFDTLGRSFLTIAHNKFMRSGAMVEERYATRVELDIEGNQREVIDANNRVVMRYDYDMLGTRIHQASMEAGERWVLNDMIGKPIYAWDSRGHKFRTDYDQLRRPTGVTFNDANGPPLLVQQTIYGEGQGNAKNHRTRTYKVYDAVGVVTSDEYDFKGNLRNSSRTLADDYKKIYDWKNDTVQTSWEVFTSRTAFDALNRPISVTAPDTSIYHATFNEANLLQTVDVTLRGAQTPTPFVTNIDYNAKDQRELIEYGNSVRTEYRYDSLTFRLISLRTTRGTDQALLQDLSYSYDPAGNITQIRDGAQQTIYFSNQVVTPDNDYTYDAVYHLINAQGREHIGQVSQPQTTYNDWFRVHLPQPGDSQAMRRYSEEYHYDAVGNFLQFIHQTLSPQPPPLNGNWTRSYAYTEESLIERGKTSNRLTSTTVGNGNPVTEQYGYDTHGNTLLMPQLQVMQWDFRDQLQMTQRQAVNDDNEDGLKHQGERTYYVYDSSGQRVRKVTERQAAAGQTPTRMKERIYLGGFEIYREYGADGSMVSLERETLHVMDDKQRIALVETRTQGHDESLPQLIRYQFGNHLGSACVELDDQAQIISYEEYFPYGSTSYQAVRSQTETAKRYRYTGMERDEESGLNYHGARYYSPWLGRWLSADPKGLADGTNMFKHAGDNPLKYVDRTGTQCHPNQSCRDPTLSTPREEALHQSLPERERHLPPPASLATIFPAVSGPGSQSASGSQIRGAVSPVAGALGASDIAQRDIYNLTKASNASKAQQAIQELDRAAENIGSSADTAATIAQDASTARNVLRATTQNKLTPLGAAISKIIEGDRSWPAIVKKYGDPFDMTLTAETRLKIADKIAEASSHGSSLMNTLQIVSKGFMIVNTALGGWEIGGGINKIASGQVGEGVVDITEGTTNVGLTIGTYAGVKSGALTTTGGLAGGAATIGASSLAVGSLWLAFGEIRRAMRGEQSLADQAVDFWGGVVESGRERGGVPGALEKGVGYAGEGLAGSLVYGRKGMVHVYEGLHEFSSGADSGIFWK